MTARVTCRGGSCIPRFWQTSGATATTGHLSGARRRSFAAGGSASGEAAALAFELRQAREHPAGDELEHLVHHLGPLRGITTEGESAAGGLSPRQPAHGAAAHPQDVAFDAHGQLGHLEPVLDAVVAPGSPAGAA